MIGEYVLAGNERVSLALGEIGPEYGVGTKDPFIDILMKSKVCPSEQPRSFLYKRCKKDVQQTLCIFLKQRDKLRYSGRLPTFYTHCLLTPCLTDIEWRGMHLDAEATTAEYNRAVDEFAKLGEELNVICGGANLRSPKQKLTLLYETLKFKRPKDRYGNELTGTDYDTISQLRPTNEKQADFITKYLVQRVCGADKQESSVL